MSINNVISNISLSNQLQLTSGALDTRLAANGGLLGSTDGLLMSQDYQQYLGGLSVPAAQFKDLLANPAPIIDPPGAGKMISIVRGQIFCQWNGIGYTNGSSVALQYGNGAYAANLLCGGPMASLLFTSISEDSIISFNGTLSNGVSPPLNTGVFLVVNGVNFSNGDANFRFHIWYKVYTP